MCVIPPSFTRALKINDGDVFRIELIETTLMFDKISFPDHLKTVIKKGGAGHERSVQRQGAEAGEKR